ncbi:MAG TPA: hypothetical protein VMM76_01895, partial [Pirellulaceae bacterium]|nr:hypothetical protein [Pirellulaceae bacterium]
MKRLWIRLGVVAGILGVGGAGVLVAQKSGSTPAESATAEVAATEPAEDNSQPRPIPLSATSIGIGDNSQVTPVASTKMTAYSNELPPDESSSSAEFVDPPPSSQYTQSQPTGSSAIYAINDSDSDLAPIPNE